MFCFPVSYQYTRPVISGRNKLSGIFGRIFLSHSPGFLNLTYLFFICYGFWFCFYWDLCVCKCVSAPVCVSCALSWAFFCLFCLIMICFIIIIIACLSSNERGKGKVWTWMGGEVRKMGRGNCDRNISYEEKYF